MKAQIVRIDPVLYKAIERKRIKLEKELGTEVSFRFASKVWYLQNKGKGVEL